MEQKHPHRVLVVDDEEIVGRAIRGILRRMEVPSVYAPDGETALELIQGASPVFSLILCDQRMPGMTGDEFFREAREICPETVRFLVTGHVDEAAFIRAVNRGAVHRCISKPWDTKTFVDAVAGGLRQYEAVLENRRLLALAKRQNLKLFRLIQELRTRTEAHRRDLEGLDREIDVLNAALAEQEKASSPEGFLSSMEQLFSAGGFLDRERLQALHRLAVDELREQFRDLAARNGFSMGGRF
jgi:response regulator RpfG family c-di-GMP phosphodiesterase